MIRNMKGYTLIEILLVLSIVSVLTIICSQFLFKLSDRFVINQFLNQLQLDIQTMQSLSIETNQSPYIIFNSPSSYKAYLNIGHQLFERQLPEDVRFQIDGRYKIIQFSSSSNIIRFGTLMFETDYGFISVIINIERGRVKIIEHEGVFIH